MTVLYKPVLIESAEQAEALPEGTVANRVLTFESTRDTVAQPEVAVKIGVNAWSSTAVDADAWDWLDRHLVGWTALVPIEAEEERERCPDFSQSLPEVNDKIYKKALDLAPTLYSIWHGTGHEPPWEDLSSAEREFMVRCAEQTVLAIAPDVWSEGNDDARIILPVDPPRRKENPYL